MSLLISTPTHQTNHKAQTSDRPFQISDIAIHTTTHPPNPHILNLRKRKLHTLHRKPAIMPGTRGPVPVPLETQDNRNLTQEVLDLLDTKEPLQTNEDFPAVSQAVIKAALDRLASRSMVVYKSLDREVVGLTKEAEGIVEEGSHEFKVWKAVRDAGRVAIKELPVRLCICMFCTTGK